MNLNLKSKARREQTLQKFGDGSHRLMRIKKGQTHLRRFVFGNLNPRQESIFNQSPESDISSNVFKES